MTSCDINASHFYILRIFLLWLIIITVHMHFTEWFSLPRTVTLLFTFSVLRWLSCPVAPYSLWPHTLKPARLLCSWNFSDKNTGVACHSLLQRIFPMQGLISWVSCTGRQILCHWEVHSLFPRLPLCVCVPCPLVYNTITWFPIHVNAFIFMPLKVMIP